jgi:hypothetical protein
MMSDSEDWDSSDRGSEFDYPNASASTDSGTVQERMYHLESDEDSGWNEKDRHKFSLVRVPDKFLEGLQVQVRTYPCPCLLDCITSFLVV